MHKRLALALFITLFCSWGLMKNVSATGSSILISNVQAGGVSTLDQAAAQELVLIYNNSDVDIEITNWCLENKSSIKFACFEPTSASLHIWLKAYSYASVASLKFTQEHAFTADVTYTPSNTSSGSIVASSDTISLIDSTSTVMDSVAWTSSITGGQYYERIFSSDPLIMVDSDLLADFVKHSSLTIPSSGLYEVLIIVDVCPNIDMVQESMPDGYAYDLAGDCKQDVCLNLSGLQQALPDNMKFDDAGNCIDIDLCVNLVGSQYAVPKGYYVDEYARCVVSASDMKVTELLPNAVGVDAGNEFIEIFNPNDFAIDLSLYKFNTGIDTIKSYLFPSGAAINPHDYYVVYSSDPIFSLLNTTSRVTIETIDNQSIDSSDIYLAPKEGESWSLIGGAWQYTNQITPGKDNLISQEVEVETAVAPCAPNQYRSPETNRCRLIVSKTNTLVPCKDNEYRSEETNRCRSVLGASTQVQPCADDEYRNPETGRCKKNVSITSLPYPNDLELAVSSEDNGRLFLIGLVSGIGFYGLWEWRDEILKTAGRLKSRFGRNKL